MLKRRTSTIYCALLSALFLLCNKAEAQLLNAQSDLFNVLENSCSNYLDAAANDKPDTIPLSSLQIITSPQNGTAQINGNYFSYCPDTGFLGVDYFKYLITIGGNSDSATVFITVLPYNNFVFEGDADQNGKVENFDVLALGLAYNLLGPSRIDSMSINALAWNPSSYLNTNPGAADCNGDGIVDMRDLISLETFYHDTVPSLNKYEVDTSQCTGNGVPFYIESLRGDTVSDGDTLDIAIKLGTDFSLNEAYGIAFTLEFDNGFISGDSVDFISNSSWMLQNNAGLFFKRNFQNTGEIEIALTRTNHDVANGGGDVLYARLPINDNIDGIIQAPGTHPLSIKLRKARLVSQYNVVRELCIQQPVLQFYKMTVGIRGEEHRALKIYPNPASELLFIEAENIREAEVTDVTGRKVYSLQTLGLDKLYIDLKSLSLTSGNYFLKIKTVDFVSTQKIFVHH